VQVDRQSCVVRRESTHRDQATPDARRAHPSIMTPDEKSAFSEVQAAVADRYDVTGVLRTDDAGTQYAGRDRSMNAAVAIRVLRADATDRPDLEARFERDASTVARLSHPHLVPVMDHGVRAGFAFLVTPFIDGENLEQHIQNHGRLSYGEVTALLRQIGSALDFAHARGIAHGYVTASHILLEQATGRWLLADLGAAPGNTDAQGDLRALAATVAGALSGDRPDPSVEREALTHALATARPELTPGAARALTAPLAPADDRPPASAGHWLGLIEAAQRRRPVKPWAAVAALALAAAGGWWALRHRPEAVSAARRTVAVLPFFIAGQAPGIELDSVLPQAFAWQLQMLPEYRVIGSPMVAAAIARRFGSEPVSLDTLFRLAASLGATRVVTGRAAVVGDHVRINLEVRDPDGGRVTAKADTVGPVDSLHALVPALTARVFRRPLGALPSPSLPRGLPAIGAYFQGVQEFRHASYERAMDQFDRVVALDSGYAPV